MGKALGRAISFSEAVHLLGPAMLRKAMDTGRVRCIRIRGASGLWFSRSDVIRIVEGSDRYADARARYEIAHGMRRDGHTFKAIGEHFGVNPSRARAMVRLHERRHSWQMRTVPQ